MVKATDLVSPEDMQKIQGVIEEKARAGKYGQYNDMAEQLMRLVSNPEKEYSLKEQGKWGGIVFSAGAMTKLEPELAPILNGITARFRKIRKNR